MVQEPGNGELDAKQREKMLELVRRLLKLGTSSNEHEAALAAAKAQEILLKYNLDVAAVQDPQDPTDINKQAFRTKFVETWLDVLINGIATTNLCFVVKSSEWKEGSKDASGVFQAGHNVRVYHVFGMKANIEVTQYLYAFLAGEINRLTPKKKNKQYTNAFRLGAVNTVCKRLQEEWDMFRKANAGSTALVISNEKAIAEKVKEAFPKLTKGKPININNYGAYLDGQAAANTIQLKAGVAGGKSGSPMLG